MGLTVFVLGITALTGFVGIPLFTAHGSAVLVAGAVNLLALNPAGPAKPEAPSGADCESFIDENQITMCLVTGGKATICKTPDRTECTEEKAGDLWFDLTETTVRQFQRCVDSGKCKEDKFLTTRTSDFCNYGAAGREDHPMNCVRYITALNYCRFMGKRLPSRAEWVRAARGDDDTRKYPWGNQPPDCSWVHYTSDQGRGCGEQFTLPAGSLYRGASPYGILDLSGSVIEWTSSLVSSCAGADSSPEEIDNDPDAMRYVMGGSFADTLRILAIDFETMDEQCADHVGMGIRCVRSVDPEK